MKPTRPDRSAVAMFLGTVDPATMMYQEAVSNCELDARSYGWSRETSAAIRIGLCNLYRGRS